MGNSSDSFDDDRDETHVDEPGTPESSASNEGDPVEAAPMTLVEVVPGAAVVFGNVPDAIELVDFGLIPAFDRERLTTLLGAVGGVGAVGGNIASAIAGAQGLYRVDSATLALLKGGAKLAGKDGAKLGAIFKNGDLVAQARFIPYGMTAAGAAAAIGPAISMIAIQMQLSQISTLVRTNIALTTQTLKSIRQEQWAELTGLTTSIDRAIAQATEIGGVTKSLWNNVAGNEAVLDKQLDLYRRNVTDHVKQLGQLDGPARREYLERNAEAILFDANALLYALKAHTGYQAIRAAWARAEGADDAQESQLAEVIARDARDAFDTGLRDATELVGLLRRELRIIAELPGRATIPLTKKRRDAKTSRLTCNQLLEIIEPLANALNHVAEELTAPEVLCAPENLDLEPYLHVLRWYLEDGEELRAVAFPYQSGSKDLAGVLPAVLAMRVDAAWTALAPGRWAAVVDKAASSTFVAVTNRRIITAEPRGLLQQGRLGATFPLESVQFVRHPKNQSDSVRMRLDVITDRLDLHWLYPSKADTKMVEKLVALLDDGGTTSRADHDAIRHITSSQLDANAH